METKEQSVPGTLPACSVLSAFDEKDRLTLTGYGQFLRYRAEQILIKEGESQDCLYMLVDGVLHALHKVRGGATPLGAIQPGEWFGEINILDPNKASAMVVARTDSWVWRMSRAKLEEFLNKCPTLGCLLLLGVAEVLARRTRSLVAKLNAAWEISW